jgi:hypothetical protein
MKFLNLLMENLDVFVPLMTSVSFFLYLISLYYLSIRKEIDLLDISMVSMGFGYICFMAIGSCNFCLFLSIIFVFALIF